MSRLGPLGTLQGRDVHQNVLMLPVEYETYSYKRGDSVTVTSIIVYVCIVIARDSVVCHMIVRSTNQIVTCSFWLVVQGHLLCMHLYSVLLL